MPTGTSNGPEIRRSVTGMQLVFWIGSGLVTAAAIQLYILTDHTERLFAWTIKNPLTAAFLGAFYFTALVLAFLSGREHVWARARVGIPGVVAFITLSFVFTILHLGLFHFHSPSTAARVAGYAWFIVYLLAPIGAVVAWVLQLRAPGADPPRERLLPSWFRVLLGIQGTVAMVVGAWLFITAPDGRSAVWPWALTPLTARAIAAWLLGVGLVLLVAVYENAWERIRNALLAYLVLGLLQMIALARYPHAKGVEWGGAATWVYVGLLAVVIFTGVSGWIEARRSTRTSRA